MSDHVQTLSINTSIMKAKFQVLKIYGGVYGKLDFLWSVIFFTNNSKQIIFIINLN